jgi:hypothetical protein
MTMLLSTPWLLSQSRQNAMMSRLLLVETLGKAIRRASISRGDRDIGQLSFGKGAASDPITSAVKPLFSAANV